LGFPVFTKKHPVLSPDFIDFRPDFLKMTVLMEIIPDFERKSMFFSCCHRYFYSIFHDDEVFTVQRIFAQMLQVDGIFPVNPENIVSGETSLHEFQAFARMELFSGDEDYFGISVVCGEIENIVTSHNFLSVSFKQSDFSHR